MNLKRDKKIKFETKTRHNRKLSKRLIKINLKHLIN